MRYVLLAVVLVGCSSTGVQGPPPARMTRKQVMAPIDQPAPRVPSRREISFGCKIVHTKNAKGIDQLDGADVSCGPLAGVPEEELANAAVVAAARYGIGLDFEAMTGARIPATAGSAMVRVLWTAASEAAVRDAIQELNAKGAGISYYTAEIVLGDEYLQLEAVHAQLKEERVYAQCRKLVIDVDAAAKDPSRAAACMNTMSMIDHERDQLRAAKTAEEALELQRETLRQEHQRREVAERSAEAEERRRRWQRIGEIFSQPAVPSTYRTECQNGPLGVNCTTTSH